MRTVNDLTSEQIENYVAVADYCPFCGSSAIEGEHIEIVDREAIQEMSCIDCDSVWFDIYKLSYIS